MFFIFNTLELLNEHKRLTRLNLSGPYQGEPHTRPPSCTTPQQPTMHVTILMLAFLQSRPNQFLQF